MDYHIVKLKSSCEKAFPSFKTIQNRKYKMFYLYGFYRRICLNISLFP